MKKIIVLMPLLVLVLVLAVLNANALISGCALNNPGQNVSSQYDNGLIKLNATGTWANAGNNITNVTFTIGNTNYSNSTVNGTGGLTASTGDFTFTVATALADGSYTAFATCWNSTDATQTNASVQSASVTYVIDTVRPDVSIAAPLRGSTVVPNNNYVMFEYTPTETNLGNCSLSINNVLVKSNTATTVNPNITSGKVSRFTQYFGADNLTVRVALSCRDLAGLQTSSNSLYNNFTFNVLLGAISPAQRAQLYAQSQQPAAGNGFTIVAPPSGYSTHLQQYGWVYFIALVFVVVAIAKKKKLF